MLRGPAQWGNVEAITTMPTEKVIQRRVIVVVEVLVVNSRPVFAARERQRSL